VAGAGAAALAVAWPVLAPFVEVWRFSQLSGEEVEEVVAVKESLEVCPAFPCSCVCARNVDNVGNVCLVHDHTVCVFDDLAHPASRGNPRGSSHPYCSDSAADGGVVGTGS
jgi:hypothetical protein